LFESEFEHRGQLASKGFQGSREKEFVLSTFKFPVYQNSIAQIEERLASGSKNNEDDSFLL